MDRPNGTVLIVEDERDLADAFARWLEDEYSVRTAYTGEQALGLLDGTVDVVLLDRRMPGMTGRELLRAIRDRGYSCRVAVITAVDPDFDILDMPFDEYVVKPILKQDLHDVVERMLDREGISERLQESYAIATKLSILESGKDPDELEANASYQAYLARFERLRAEIDVDLARFDPMDYVSTYRAIDNRSNVSD